jgi:hypothetical protein
MTARKLKKGSKRIEGDQRFPGELVIGRKAFPEVPDRKSSAVWAREDARDHLAALAHEAAPAFVEDDGNMRRLGIGEVCP